MFRAGNITSRRSMPRSHLAGAPDKVPLRTRVSATLPTLSSRNPRNTPLRHYSNDDHCKAGGEALNMPQRLPLQYLTAPLIQARPQLTTTPRL
ncbi:MAG: hypothetical protein JWR21_3405 [Herminiimonas sp.]|nr:hypothetical protein [Herminiimonas sp.]